LSSSSSSSLSLSSSHGGVELEEVEVDGEMGVICWHLLQDDTWDDYVFHCNVLQKIDLRKREPMPGRAASQLSFASQLP
jgi:hypothetical protein